MKTTLPFSWCMTGDHANCKRKYEKFFVDPKNNTPNYSGETVYCCCDDEDCECSKQ